MKNFSVASMTDQDRARRMVAIDLRVEELENYRQVSSVQASELASLQREFEELQTVEAGERTANVREGLRNGTLVVDQPLGADGQPVDNSSHRFGGTVRDRARRVIDAAHRSKDLPDHAAASAEKLVTDGSSFEQGMAARWAIATGDPAYRSAFAKLLADPTTGHLLWTGEEQAAHRTVAQVQTEMRAMSTTGNAGGYMVPLTLDPAIMLSSDGSINPLRQVCRVVQTVTNAWQGVTSAGATAEWKAEGVQAADGSPTLDDPSIPVHFGDSFVPYSYEVGMDASSFLAELQTVLVDAADQLMATAYTTGVGTTEPKGFVTALDGTSSEVAPTVAESLTAADVFKVQNALPPRFQANAQWCAALATINSLAQFETSNGALKFPEIGNDRLLRKSLHEVSSMDGTYNPAATADNFLLAYGDWKQFIIVDRIGTTLELIPNLMGANNRPTGQRGALLWFRTGSDVVVPEAFRLLNVATTA